MPQTTMPRPNLFVTNSTSHGIDLENDLLEFGGPSTSASTADEGTCGPPPISSEPCLSGEDDTDEEEPRPPADGDSSDESSGEEVEEEELEEATDGTLWKKTPGVPTKTPSRNIVKRPPTQIPGCQNVNDPVDAFKLYITDRMITNLVTYTNLEGRREVGDKWVETNAMEIEGCIGLLLFLGSRRQNMVSTEDLWDSIYGCSTARICMSRRRFQILLTHMRFDDKATRSARRRNDTFAPFRDFWEDFMRNLRNHYIPGALLTIDEQLVPFRGRCSFLQYLPSKPDRYCIKVFWVADAESNYPLYGIPYLGRPVGQERQVNLGRNTVLKLAEPFYRSGRNVTCDNYFTDLSLAETLLDNGLTIVGTVRANKRFLPQSFKDKKHLPLYGSDFAYKDAVTLVNYQSRRTKSTVALSTMHSTGVVREDTLKKKPEIILFYNATKGAVDTLDKMAHAFTVKRKTRRWPMVMFSNIVDLSTIAARRIWELRFPDHSLTHADRRAAFIRSIAEQMILPLIQWRLPVTAMQRELASAARKFIDHVEQQESGQHASRHGREPQGKKVQPGGQKRKHAQDGSTGRKAQKRCLFCSWKADRKTMHTCNKCGDFICKEHMSEVCPVCNQVVSSRNDVA